jgi:hypothetical protein
MNAEMEQIGKKGAFTMDENRCFANLASETKRGNGGFSALFYFESDYWFS